MYAPISFLLFFTFHFLFRILKHNKQGLKSLFKSYYIPYGIILVLFIQNINRLIFLSCHNFKNLFAYSTGFYFMQGITVFFIGVMIILGISFYYNIQFLYGRKIKSLPFNLRSNKSQPTILLFSFVLRPTIEVGTNTFLF